MKRIDGRQFAEVLDDIEEALNAQDALQGLPQDQMVAEIVEVRLDFRLPNGRQTRTA